MCAVANVNAGNDGTKGLSDCYISGADAWNGITLSINQCPDSCTYSGTKCYATCPIYATCAAVGGCAIVDNDCYKDCAANTYVMREGSQDCTETDCKWVGGKCRKACPG